MFLKTRSRLKGQIPFILIFIQASTQVCNAIEIQILNNCGTVVSFYGQVLNIKFLTGLILSEWDKPLFNELLDILY